MGIRARRHAIDAFRKHGGILRTRRALALGIHPRTLYHMRDDQIIEEISRGVYRIAALPGLGKPDLVTIALRVPRAVICLVSALAYHEATSEVPHEVQIALPRGSKAPILAHPPTRVFRFAEFALSAGSDVVRIDGVEVRIFDLPKTVVDCFRFRNKIGMDVAIEALSLALKRKGAQPADVLRYARICRIETVILPYIEAIA